MNKKEVIKMAREAGAERSCINDEVWMLALAETGFEKFAELAFAAGAAAEREEVIDLVAFHGGSVEIEAAIRARGQS